MYVDGYLFALAAASDRARGKPADNWAAGCKDRPTPQDDPRTMPFQAERMISGGFGVIM